MSVVPPGMKKKMDSRRSLIKKAAATIAAVTAGGFAALGGEAKKKVKAGPPRRGLVVWYSQTGNKERYGRLIAKVWEKKGLAVTAGDYREIGAVKPGSFDIIAAGSPVFYLEAPEFFFQAEDGIRDTSVTGVQTCALPI